MMIRGLLALAVALLLPATAIAGPDLKPGDKFTYLDRDGGDYTDTYEGPGPGGGHVFVRDNGDRLLFNASMSLVELPGSRITPHNGQLVLEPKVGFRIGESWVVVYDIFRTSGSHVQRTRSCEVAAHEPKLIVRAGTFDAYRVDCTIAAAGGRRQYGESWYDARSWRALKHSVGSTPGNLTTVLELTAIDLRPR